MTLVYRFLSFFINIVALLITFSLLFILPVSFVMPMMWLPTFLIVALVLYTWFSNKFRRKVLWKHEVVKQSLYDWIRVNGFVAIIFCLLQMPAAIMLIRNPVINMEAMREFSKQYGEEFQKGFQPANITTIACIVLLYLLGLLIHVLWTFALLKKYRAYFQ